MEEPKKRQSKRTTRDALVQSFAITAVYALFGFLWIVISEAIVAKNLQESPEIYTVSIAKGLVFVALTCGLIFILVYRNLIKNMRDGENLKKSEVALNEAQRLAHVGSFEYNFDTRKLTCSDECLNILGIDKEHYKGSIHQIARKVHRDDIVGAIKSSKRAVTENKNIEFVCRVLLGEDERFINVFVMTADKSMEKPRHLIGTVQDITERKRAEDAARENESIYRTFINSSCDLVYLKDSNFRYLAVNQRMVDYYGIQESEAIGKTTVEILNNEHSTLWQQRDVQVLESREALMIEETIGEHTYETIIFPVELANGKIGVGGISRDITLRHQAEMIIKKERDRAEMYLDIAAVIFIAFDIEGRVTMVNKAGCEILGMERDAIIGANWIERFVPESCKESTQKIIEAIQTGDITKYVLHNNAIVTKSGEERLIEWKNVLLYDSFGKVSGLLAAGTDITDLNATIDALRESERSKSVLLANLQGMAYSCLYEPKWTMLFVSQGCYKLTGYYPEELLHNRKLSFDDLILEQYKSIIWEETKLAIDEKRSCRYEYEIETASGERKWVLDINQAVYGIDGKISALEGIIIDITESKKQFLQIQYLNDHDRLTGLFNRQYYETTKNTLDKQKYFPLTILLADINGLKLINDAFGYDTGDLIIMQTAEVLQKCCKDGEMLARVGGDEFAILMPHVGFEEAYERIANIRETFETYNASLKDKTKVVNLSIGCSTKEDESIDISEVEKTADANMSRRKLFDQKSHHNAILTSIMTTLFERSFETEEHAQRIAQLCKIVGVNMGLSHDDIDKLHLFSMLHDIGKVGVSDRILKKPDKLNEEEWSEMRKHPEIGYRIAMTSPDFAPVAEFILAHHERWDGSGYPNGLAGEKIPLLSRILAVADAYDAMTQDRIYHKAMSHEHAINEIRNNAGTQFDPYVVEVFLRVMEENGETE